MKKLKKINLKGLAETLSENELRNIVGGYDADNTCSDFDCKNTKPCSNSAGSGHCRYLPIYFTCKCLANG